MYIGSALFLIAVGAVLRWAVSWHVSGFNVQLTGLSSSWWDLGLVITLILWSPGAHEVSGATMGPAPGLPAG